MPNVYKNLNHRVNHFKSNQFGDIETNPSPVINSTKMIQARDSQDNGAAMFGLYKCWYTVCSHVTCFPHI